MSRVAESMSSTMDSASSIYQRAIAELDDLETLLNFEEDEEDVSQKWQEVEENLETKRKQLLDGCMKLQKITKQVDGGLKCYRSENVLDDGKCFREPDCEAALLSAVQGYARASTNNSKKSTVHGNSNDVAQFIELLHQLVEGKTVPTEYSSLILNSYWLYNRLKYSESPSNDPIKDICNVLKGLKEGLTKTNQLCADTQICGKLVLDMVLETQSRESLVDDVAFKDALWEQYAMLKKELAGDPSDTDDKWSQKLLMLYMGGSIALPLYADQSIALNSQQQASVEISLPTPLQYHKVFVCPVTRSDWALQDERPQLLICGHMLSHEAVYQMMENKRIKCPYCSKESELGSLKPVSLYPELEIARRTEAAL